MRRPRDFSPRDWIILTIALLLTTIVALGVHDLAIAHLGVPYPYEDGVPEWTRFLGQVVRIGSVVVISRVSSWYLDRLPAAGAAAIMGVILVLLQETLRVLIVNVAMVDGLVERRWLFMLIGSFPNAVSAFFNGAVGYLIARLARGSLIGAATATLVVATVGTFALLPWSRHAAADWQAALGLAEPVEVYQMPYGRYIYTFIYGTFVEPTLATFLLAFLLWPGLPPERARRMAAFVALLLLVRGRIVATLLFSVWVRQPPLLAVAAEGQFFAETFVMAIMVGFAWDRITWRSKTSVRTKPRPSDGSAVTRRGL